VRRICGVFVYHYKLGWNELLVFALPTFMYLMGNSDFWIVMKLWLFMIIASSLMHGFVGFNAGHHHDSVFHDGDELASMDFGVYQMAATVDKLEVNSSLFLTLTNYGNHVLHHMFPTLDHAVLPQLHDTLISTCVEFECELREFPWFQLIIGQFKQLARTEPHKLKC
jgi:fatty acid desaturase